MNIWAVGRNYANHAKEMNSEIPSSPMIFLKSGDCLIEDSKEIILPQFSKEIHYETELLVKLGHDLQPIEAAIALDLTARDLQAQAKAKGQPWTLAKSFIGACPASSFFPLQPNENLANLKIQLKINGKIRQQGSLSDLIFNIDTLIQFLKDHFPIKPLDLVLTGTPEGVGQLHPGDQLEAEVLGRIKKFWLVRS